jgi:hypothetical protein
VPEWLAKLFLFMNAAAYLFGENCFFGWNMTAQSANEVLADGLGLTLCSMWLISFVRTKV